MSNDTIKKRGRPRKDGSPKKSEPIKDNKPRRTVKDISERFAQGDFNDPKPTFYETTEAQRKNVRALASVGIPQEQIAASLYFEKQGKYGISVETLQKLFARELVDGIADANSKVAFALHQQAISGNVTAQIWWTKARMKWRDQDATEQKTPSSIVIKWQGDDE